MKHGSMKYKLNSESWKISLEKGNSPKASRSVDTSFGSKECCLRSGYHGRKYVASSKA